VSYCFSSLRSYSSTYFKQILLKIILWPISYDGEYFCLVVRNWAHIVFKYSFFVYEFGLGHDIENIFIILKSENKWFLVGKKAGCTLVTQICLFNPSLVINMQASYSVTNCCS